MSEFENSRRRRTPATDESMSTPAEVPAYAAAPKAQSAPSSVQPPCSDRPDSRKPAPKAKQSKWIVPLLIIIIVLLIFIAACSVLSLSASSGNPIKLPFGQPKATATPVPVTTPEPTEAPDSEITGSEFERVLIQKGTLIEKEFIDYRTAAFNTGFTTAKIDFQTATVTDIENGLKYRALRMEHNYYNSKYDSGTSIGVLDAPEIDAVLKTLRYIKNNISKMKDYTETVYTAGSGLVVGAYRSTDNTLFIKFSSADTVYLEFSEIDNLINILEGAQKKLLSTQL